MQTMSGISFEHLVEQSPDIIIRLDSTQHILYINPAIELATGYNRHDFLGVPLKDAPLLTTTCQQLQQAAIKAAEQQAQQRVIFSLKTATGLRQYEALIVQEEQNVTHCNAIIYARDITTQIRMEQELSLAATTDSLTGLYNRQQFMVLGGMDLARARRHITPLTVMGVDLDGFSTFNATYGDALGDFILIQIARLLDKMVRTSDFLCRFDSDSFMISMTNTTLEEALAAGERICAAVRELALHCSDLDLPVTASVCISQMRLGEEDINPLIERIESGLQAAWHNGGNRVICHPDTF